MGFTREPVFFILFNPQPIDSSYMEEDFWELADIRQSSRARKPSIKYSKGSFTVVIPENMNLDPGEFVEQNRDWIKGKIPEAEKYRGKIPERNFEQGSKISVLGKNREIVIEKRRSCEVNGEKILVAEHLAERTSVKDRVEDALREYAREVFNEKAEKFSGKIDGEFKSIFVKDQKTRWGSCSGKNNLNFNWRLVLGPEKVVEYVVVHELVHLEVRNHSKKFWNRVKEILPRYRDSKNWLDKNSARLEF